MLRMNRSFLVFAMVVVGCLTTAQADPPNQVILDGVPNEYDGGDLVGTQTTFPPAWGGANFITNLFVTWDATNLYVAVQGRETGNKFGVFIDVDPGNGTGATRSRDLEDPDPGTKGFPDWLRFQSPDWEDATNAVGSPSP